MFGTQEQKDRLLPRLAAGEIRGAFALTEPEAGSDLRRVTTEAVQDGGGWRISGRKVFITHADVADVMTVFAKVPGTRKGSLSAFILERESAPWIVEGIEKKLGLRASTTCSLVIDDVWVPDSSRLGELGAGMRIALSCLNKGRVTTSWQSLGIAEGALAIAQDYAERTMDGGTALAESQSMQFALAEMATDIEATRALAYQAASRYDAGDEGIIALCAMAKLFATDMVVRVTTRTVQLLGERGHTSEYDAERLMRDARVLPIVEGTNEIQKLVIARDMRQRLAPAPAA
jgi:alkylation response protein AidB-like acyl-CoA dehydrogenase